MIFSHPSVPSLFLSEAGQEVFHVNRKPGLWWGAEGETIERRERPAEGPGDPREHLLLRLRPAGPPLGQHQPGHHPLHPVLRYPQVKYYDFCKQSLFYRYFNIHVSNSCRHNNGSK